MNKRTIKLTESELKQVITESVKKVISELDYKTYLNAAKKRYQQGKNMQGSELQRYGEEQFNKQYGKRRLNRIGDRSEIETTGLYNGNVRTTYSGRPGDYKEVDDKGRVNYYKTDPNAQQIYQTDYNLQDPQLKSAHDEYQNYQNDNYEYDNGWKLK